MNGTDAAVRPAEPLLGVYLKPDTLFVAGEGPWLIAEDGRRYLDFTSGLGVNALGFGEKRSGARRLAKLVPGVGLGSQRS